MIRPLVVIAFLLCQGVAWAATLALGASRDEVIEVLGEPVGRSSAGSREVLSYTAGRVILREGRVVEFDAALAPAQPAPAPAATVPVQEAVPEVAPQPAAPPPAAPAPAEVPPASTSGNWIKLAGLTVFFGIVLLLGRHFIREARRAQEAKKRDLLSR